MAGSPDFPKVRSGGDASRTQDNVAGQLTPVAKAVAGTPLLKGTLPAWVPISLSTGYANFGAQFGPAAYHRDSFLYTHLTGLVTSAAGVGAFTQLGVLPMGYRPRCTIRLAVDGGATYQALDITAMGIISNTVAIAAAGVMFLDCSFLADG